MPPCAPTCACCEHLNPASPPSTAGRGGDVGHARLARGRQRRHERLILAAIGTLITNRAWSCRCCCSCAASALRSTGMPSSMQSPARPMRSWTSRGGERATPGWATGSCIGSCRSSAGFDTMDAQRQQRKCRPEAALEIPVPARPRAAGNAAVRGGVTSPVSRNRSSAFPRPWPRPAPWPARRSPNRPTPPAPAWAGCPDPSAPRPASC